MTRTSGARAGILGLTAVALLLVAGPQAAAQPTASPSAASPAPQVQPLVVPVSFDGDVRSLAKMRLRGSARPELEEPVAGLPGGPDSALQSGGISAPAPSPSVSFAGLNKANWGDGWPPDPNGDVGPNHYIQTVNTSVGIFSKTGTQLAAFTFDTLFSGTGTPCDASNQGDPVVVYDPLGGRWIISDMAWSNFSTGPFYECFAVSKTADPVAGGWWFYAVQTDSGANFGDYPKIGIWPDGLYMSANIFSSKGSNPFKNVRVWAFNRSDLESGVPLRSVRFDVPKSVGGVQVFALLPSNFRGTTPPAGRENLFSSIWGAYAVRVWKFHADWTTPLNSTFTGPSNVTIPTFSVGPGTVPEQGGNDLDTLTYRLMMQAQYRNLAGQESLWVTHTVGNGSGIASLRWYQLNVTGGTIVTGAPVQQGTFNGSPADSTHRFMPSLAVDGSGDMAIGYSVSGSTLYPGIRYAGRLYGDPAGTLGQGEQTLISGSGAQTNTCGGEPCERWGDYTAMTVDPTDDCTFWYTNEYYSTSGGNWVTRIGAFKFPSCTGSPPATTTTSSTTTTTVPTTTTTTTTPVTTTTTTTPVTTTTTTTSASACSNFALSATPSTQTVGQGLGTTYTINIARTSCAASISLGVSGLPAGSTGVFSPGATTGSSSTLTITTTNCGSPTPIGDSILTVTGTGGGLTRTTSPTLSIVDGPPTVTAPNSRIYFTSTVGSGTMPVYTWWSACDPNGISSYELQRQVNGGAWTTVGLATPTTAALGEQLTVGSTDAYRVLATDGTAHTSAYATGTSFQPLLTEDSATGSIAYSGTWSTEYNASASGGTQRYASIAGASATFTFTGSSIGWVTTKGPTRGSADIYIDGVLKTTVSLYTSSTIYKQVVYAFNFGVNGPHTIKVVCDGTSGHPRIDVDAFVRTFKL
jgi:hypothetical protein